MKGRSPTACEKRHMDAVQQLGCIVCLLDMNKYTPAEIHHITGKTSPGAHFNILPLCNLHHRGQNDNSLYTSRHPYKKRFEARYGAEEYLKEQVDKLLEEQ